MLSQSGEILKALKQHPGGLHPMFFIESLHIYQYSARIHELRTQFGCQCKNSNDMCFATEHIRNYDLPDGTTLFKYHVDNTQNWENMRVESIAKQNQQKQASLF